MGLILAQDFTLALSGSAPTAATDGVPLDGVKSWRIILSATSGQTLSGAGTIDIYHYNPTTGWARNPDLVLTLSVSAARSQAFADVLVGPPTGRMCAVLNGVTTSDSAPANLRYELGN